MMTAARTCALLGNSVAGCHGGGANSIQPAVARSGWSSGELSIARCKMPAGNFSNLPLAEQLLEAFDTIGGLHPGFRPVHAKGVMCAGTFTPTAEASRLTRATHALRPSTPVTVRFSDSPGVPTSPDNDPKQSGPRGI